jgi:hypothetical protein
MDLPRSAWRKSSRSGSSGNCVEVAVPSEGVLVRDSKDQRGPVLSFTTDQWAGFLTSVKTGTISA